MMNTNKNIKYILLLLSVLTTTIIVIFSSLPLNFQIPTFGLEFKQQNATLIQTENNIIAVGDWYCNEETKKTIANILAKNPKLVITTGDHVKKVPSASCWKDMSKPIKDKMKIAIGNHDAEFSNIYKQIVDYHQLDNPYYSHDFQNIHFISMSTEHPYEQGSKQYKFIKNDLEKHQRIQM
jgi:hypothetical protein